MREVHKWEGSVRCLEECMGCWQPRGQRGKNILDDGKREVHFKSVTGS